MGKLIFIVFSSIYIGTWLNAADVSDAVPTSADLAAGYRQHLNKYQAISFCFDESSLQEKISGQMTMSRTALWMQIERRSLKDNSCLFAESIRRKDEYIDVYRTTEDRYENYAVYSAISPSDEKYSPHYGNELSLLLGITMLGKKSGTVSVADILPSRNVEVFTNPLPNKEEYSMRFLVDGYDVNVSISPKYGYALTGYSFSRRSKDNLLEGDIPSLDAKFDDFVFVDGVWFPSKYVCTYTIASTKPSDDGTDKRVVYCGERKKQWTLKGFSTLDAAADNAFKIRSNIPNYTTAYMQDAPQIEYVWLDGKIEPLTSELVLARMRGVKFIPGVAEPRFWLIASGILLISIALAGKLWQYYQNKNKEGDKDA
jgi:hypothetical protein